MVSASLPPRAAPPLRPCRTPLRPLRADAKPGAAPCSERRAMQPFIRSGRLRRAHRRSAISGRDGMAGRSADCPACGAPVDEAWCPSCGLELDGEEADALRDLTSRLAAADAELNVVW